MVGKNGRTAFERRRGRKCRIPTAQFGEKVWWRMERRKTDRGNRMESEWRTGIWLGHNRDTNESWIGIKEKAVKAWAVRRMDEEERWSARGLEEIGGAPQQPNPEEGTRMIVPQVRFGPPNEQEPVESGPLRRDTLPRMKLTEEYFRKYGWTEGCGG